MDVVLRNRFAMVKGAWEDHLSGVPWPTLVGDTPEAKVQALEMAFIDEVFARADPAATERAADVMWSLVHDRKESDPVKVRVTEHHHALARLATRRL